MRGKGKNVNWMRSWLGMLGREDKCHVALSPPRIHWGRHVHLGERVKGLVSEAWRGKCQWRESPSCFHTALSTSCPHCMLRPLDLIWEHWTCSITPLSGMVGTFYSVNSKQSLKLYVSLGRKGPPLWVMKASTIHEGRESFPPSTGVPGMFMILNGLFNHHSPLHKKKHTH